MASGKSEDALSNITFSFSIVITCSATVPTTVPATVAS